MANSLTKITTKSILDGTIANADIADNAITGAKLNADSVSTSDINDDAVTEDKLANAINTSIAGKAVLTGSTNNTVCTVTGANAIAGEANLTFDGSALTAATSSGVAEVRIGSGDASGVQLVFDGDSNGDFSGNDYSSIVHNSDGNLVIKANSPGTANCYIQVGSDGDYAAHFNEGGSSLLRYDNSTKIETITTGINVTGGIRLGGNNAANEMDDYEEGDWTPVIRTSASASSHTLHDQYGKYTKIGRLVHCSCYCRWSAYSGSGYVMMQGLPFTAHNSTAGNSNGVSFAARANWGYQASGMLGLIGQNTNNAYFYYSDANGTHHIQVGATQGTGDVNMSFTYFV